jgi:hypothetical protein
MRIYRLDYSDPDDGTIVEWISTKREFTARQKELVREGTFVFDTTSGLVEVPVARADLINWLNVHFNTDNG